jgi:hypothetical protein
VGDQRGQPVVVAEADLLGRDRVVLVDHRDHAEREQPLQGAVRVAVVRPADQVVGGQQHLADDQAGAGEGRGVPLDQQHLAYARRGLLGGQVPRPGRQQQRRQAGRDGAGGDQHDLGAAGTAGAEHVDQRVQPARVEAAGGRGE